MIARNENCPCGSGKKDAFIFKPVKVEKEPLITTPDKRIIV